jgi:hypothetical protein
VDRVRLVSKRLAIENQLKPTKYVFFVESGEHPDEVVFDDCIPVFRIDPISLN